MTGLEYMRTICPTTSVGKDPNREDVVDAFEDGVAEGFRQVTIKDNLRITPELLEKNGFEKQDFKGWLLRGYTDDHTDFKYTILWRTDYGEPHLEISSWTRDYGKFSNWGIKSVCQLLQVLRLCGMNELADNFKVE